MLRIPWTKHKINEKVMQRSGVSGVLLYTVKLRKNKILRNEKYTLLQSIIMSNLEDLETLGGNDSPSSYTL